MRVRDLGLIDEHILVVQQLIVIHRIVITFGIDVVCEMTDMGDIAFIIVLIRELTLKS